MQPLCRPALAALATLEITWVYNDFFWAVAFMSTGDKYPITSLAAEPQGPVLHRLQPAVRGLGAGCHPDPHHLLPAAEAVRVRSDPRRQQGMTGPSVRRFASRPSRWRFILQPMRQMGHQTRAKPRDGLLNCLMQKPDGLAGSHPALRMIRKIREPIVGKDFAPTRRMLRP